MPAKEEKENKTLPSRSFFPPKLKAFLLKDALYLILICIMLCAIIYISAEANAFKERCIMYYESQPAFILNPPAYKFTETYKPFQLNNTNIQGGISWNETK